MLTEVKIHDIRRPGCDLADLRAKLIEDLRRPESEKQIPSLLLWDEKGQELFADITTAPGYYAYRAELSLLSQRAEEIAESVKPGTVILELGAGNCKKTGVLLQALHRQRKPVSYFALDVASDSLIQSLAQMSRFLGKSKYISCQGLLGSYEDCLTLLNEEEGQKLLCIRNRHLLFLWLGNSITNMPWEDSVDIVRRMLWSSNSALLVSVDGNQNPQSIQMAYDMPDGKNRRFLRNGLTHANLLLDEGVFNAGDWDLEAKWYAEDKEHRAYHVAKREISLTVDGNIVQIAKGEKIHAITSAKWTTEEVERLCEAAGVELEHSWIEPVYNFGCYLLGN